MKRRRQQIWSKTYLGSYPGIALSKYIPFMELGFLTCNLGIREPTSQGFVNAGKASCMLPGIPQVLGQQDFPTPV